MEIPIVVDHMNLLRTPKKIRINQKKKLMKNKMKLSMKRVRKAANKKTRVMIKKVTVHSRARLNQVKMI